MTPVTCTHGLASGRSVYDREGKCLILTKNCDACGHELARYEGLDYEPSFTPGTGRPSAA